MILSVTQSWGLVVTALSYDTSQNMTAFPVTAWGLLAAKGKLQNSCVAFCGRVFVVEHKCRGLECVGMYLKTCRRTGGAQIIQNDVESSCSLVGRNPFVQMKAMSGV